MGLLQFTIPVSSVKPSSGEQPEDTGVNSNLVLYSAGAASMCHILLQIGTQHWHSILCLCGNRDNVKNTYRRSDITIRIIRMKPIVKYFLKSIHIIISDELGQLSDE